jgi:toxin CcdB
MAKFDVYQLKGENTYVLDCQADLLGDLNTRLVVPLLPEGEAIKPAARLNPILEVEGKRLIMVTQFAAAVPVREMGAVIVSLIDEQDAIGNALGMLIHGF